MLIDRLKTLPLYVIPKHGLTKLMGWLANIEHPRLTQIAIRWFIKRYRVNMSEALEKDPGNYKTFNDFFTRHLNPTSRPIAKCDIIAPVDGVVSQIGDISHGRLIQAKNRTYSVHELLAADNSTCEHFINGRFATLYLSPKDYHRIHMPCDAILKEMYFIPGKLFSVSPQTANSIKNLFARNERLVVFFQTPKGLMAMVLVGATIVGSIGTSWQGDIKRERAIRRWIYPNPRNESVDFTKAQELGYFKLGSTVILLFADDNKIDWHPTVGIGDSIHYGQAFGTYSLENE
jgi:phosphatidylserine decarboxylase